jgi:short-subunit dehydrogenase
MDSIDYSTTRPLAVVTEASSGIGYGLAKEFAENGFDLLIVAEDSGISRAGHAIESESGIDVESAQIDLASPEGVEAFYLKIQSMGRPTDAIAINARIGVGGDFARDTDLNKELKLIDLNVKSAVHLTKLVMKDMIERGEGRILFTSSIAAKIPTPFEAVYVASRAFLSSFCAAIRTELQGSGVSVTALLPEPNEADFFRSAGENVDIREVARQGFNALMAGEDQVIAGSLKTKLQAVAANWIPKKTNPSSRGNLSEPGSAKT